MSKEIISIQHENLYAQLPSPFMAAESFAEQVNQPADHNELGAVGGGIAIGLGLLAVVALISMQNKGNIFPWSKPLDKERAISPENDDADFYKKLASSDEN